MPVKWNLKKWLALERDIYRPSELQAVLAEKAGVHLSLQAISTLVNGTPSSIRFQTIQALCDALDCSLSDFCDVVPHTSQEKQKKLKVVGDTPKRLYGGSKDNEKKSESLFPDPNEFVDRREKRQNNGEKG
jgi:DNA-binding Xre family transcriptional regulator